MNGYSWLIAAVMGFTWLLVVGGCAFMPFYSRRNMVFGIAVPTSRRDDAFFVRQRRIFFAAVLAAGLVLGAVCAAAFFTLPGSAAVWVQMGGLLFFLAAATGLYFLVRSRVKAYKLKQDWPVEAVVSALLTAEGKGPRPVHPAWFLSYAAVLAGTVGMTAARYASLPDRIPVHYDIAGGVDRYASKSPGLFCSMPVMQLLMGLLFLGIFIHITRAKTQGDGGNQEAGLRRDRRFRGMSANIMFVVGLLVLLLLGFCQLSMLGVLGGGTVAILSVVFLVLVTGIVIFLMARMGQGGDRMAGSGEALSNTAEDDRCWRGGFFYSNRNDPSLFVEKRFGIGYTLNFGNPKSLGVVLVLGVILIALAILPFILR